MHCLRKSLWDNKIIANLLLISQQVYHTKISDVNELKRRIISERAALGHMVIDSAVGEWSQRLYALAFVLEADILSTGLNKDCMMWHIRQWLFWGTITVSHVCCYSINHSNAHLIYCIDGSIWHFEFPKVVQAHTLGEVGILGKVLLRVSSGTTLPIFIEIGSYLTDKKQKISLHSFLADRTS